MRKFFFFGSSAVSNVKDNVGLPLPTDKQAYSEHPLKTGLKGKVVDRTGSNFRNSKHSVSKARKQSNNIKSSSTGYSFRRSRSLSSAAILGAGRGLSDESRSPSCCKNSASCQHYDQSSSYWILIPKEHYDGKQYEVPNSQYTAGLEKRDSAPFKIPNDSSGHSSTCSSNNSSKIVDRYIDGEKRQSFSSQRHFIADGNDWGRPPRVQTTASTSPTNSIKDKARSHSFCISYEEWPDKKKFGHESPRSIAKNVIERLSQSCLYPKSNPSAIGQRISPWNKCHQTANEYYPKDYSGFDRQNLRDCEGFSHVEADDGIDEVLFQRAVEAEERVVLLSKDLEQENFQREGGFSVPGLIQTIRNLIAERINLTREVLGLLQSQIAERASSKEKLRIAKVELESQSHNLEKEKSELQLGLEKELDRRSSYWSFKLEKYQLEEHRLRERVRELAEQNVSFQKKFSSFNSRETESRRVISYSKQKLKDLTSTSDAMREENQHLNQNLSELHEYCRAATEANNHLKNLIEEKEKECKESHKSITRLRRKCSEHERTINVLRERFSDDIWKNKSEEKFDENVVKLQMELMRLTGVELALRRELESLSIEVDSLRHENTNLLNYLTDKGKDNYALKLKLDKEILSRIYCLQHEGISLLNESSQICSKMLDFIKEKPQLAVPNQAVEIIESSLDGQFVIESEMKLQGLKRGTESLTRNLQLVSNVLHEKSNLASLKENSYGLDTHGPNQLNDERSEVRRHQHNLRYELKAESLLTSQLREKLYSKELEVEQLHAELATAVRGTDILRSEVQNAMDNISTITHWLKDLELQMLKKDESINQLQNELKDSSEKLAKQYSEKNTKLGSEVDLLRKKIEILEEDILLKEGQITILRDTIKNKPSDLFADYDISEEFLLK